MAAGPQTHQKHKVKPQAHAVIPANLKIPEEHVFPPHSADVVGPKTLFGVLKQLRDEATKKDPNSILAGLNTNALVYAVQEYRASHPLKISNGTLAPDYLFEDKKYEAGGTLRPVQEFESIPL